MAELLVCPQCYDDGMLSREITVEGWQAITVDVKGKVDVVDQGEDGVVDIVSDLTCETCNWHGDEKALIRNPSHECRSCGFRGMVEDHPSTCPDPDLQAISPPQVHKNQGSLNTR